jgi:hypothetical protein
MYCVYCIIEVKNYDFTFFGIEEGRWDPEASGGRWKKLRNILCDTMD